MMRDACLKRQSAHAAGTSESAQRGGVVMLACPRCLADVRVAKRTGAQHVACTRRGTALPAPPGTGPPNLLIIGGADEHSVEFDISDHSVCHTLYDSQQRHFWFASRNLAIARFLRSAGLVQPARFLEVGCGTGTVLVDLIRRGYRADGVDMHLELCRRAAQACPQASVYCLDVIRDGVGRLTCVYEGVGLFDVLEHVDDTAALLSACADLTKKDGLVVGTVPALVGLWSALDEVSGHRRRYDRAALRRDIESAGLEVVRMEYFFQALVPMVWLQRKWLTEGASDGEVRRRKIARQSLKVPPPPLNAALRALCLAERTLARLVPLRLCPGASLLFACRKR